MKLLLIITIFLSNLLFADSNYNKNYSGKYRYARWKK